MKSPHFAYAQHTLDDTMLALCRIMAGTSLSSKKRHTTQSVETLVIWLWVSCTYTNTVGQHNRHSLLTKDWTKTRDIHIRSVMWERNIQDQSKAISNAYQDLQEDIQHSVGQNKKKIYNTQSVRTKLYYWIWNLAFKCMSPLRFCWQWSYVLKDFVMHTEICKKKRYATLSRSDQNGTLGYGTVGVNVCLLYDVVDNGLMFWKSVLLV